MVEDTKIDAERRRDLNQERTPREDFDYENEATQEINPITGLVYLPEGTPKLNYVARYSLAGTYILPEIRSITPSELMECQFALARMEVRDGKMSQSDCDFKRSQALNVAKHYDKVFLSLDNITTPEGLKNAMETTPFEIEEVSIYFGKIDKDYSPKYLDKILEISIPKPDRPFEKYFKPLQRDTFI